MRERKREKERYTEIERESVEWKLYRKEKREGRTGIEIVKVIYRLKDIKR